MDILEELFIRHLNSLIEGCDCDDEDEEDEDKDDKSDDKDDKSDDKEDKSDDKNDKEDDDEKDDVNETFNFERIKVGTKFIKPSENQVEALAALFGEVSKNERQELWNEMTKDEASFRRIAKYAETVI